MCSANSQIIAKKRQKWRRLLRRQLHAAGTTVGQDIWNFVLGTFGEIFFFLTTISKGVFCLTHLLSRWNYTVAVCLCHAAGDAEETPKSCMSTRGVQIETDLNRSDQNSIRNQVSGLKVSCSLWLLKLSK